MKRTTASLLTGALAAGTFVGLATLAPSIASADSCDPTVLDQTSFYETFDSAENTNRNDAGANIPIKDKIRVTDEGLVMENTTNSGKASAYYDVEDGVLLRDQTAASNYVIDQDSTTTKRASYQLLVDLDNDGDRDGILVNESSFYGDVWWIASKDEAASFYAPAPRNTAVGTNSDEDGTLDQWAVAYPDAEITGFGFSLGSTGIAKVTLRSITFGCNPFQFDYTNEAPTATFSATGTHLTVDVDSAGTTDDYGTGNLTYSFDFGDGYIAPTPTASHTYANAGTYTVTLTVTDAGGLTSTVSKSLTLARATNTVAGADDFLAGTGADVKGLAALGGLVVVGSAAGLVANRRRKGADAA